MGLLEEMASQVAAVGIGKLIDATLSFMPGDITKITAMFQPLEPPVVEESGPISGKRTLTQKDLALIALKKKEGAVLINVGRRGSGKTTVSYRLAEFIQKPTYGVFPEERDHPKFIRQIEIVDIEKLPSGITLILDDLPVIAGNRDYNDPFVRAMEKVVPMVRHEKKMHLILNTQTCAQADKYFLDVDAAFLKPPSIFYEDVERPAIKKIYRDFVVPFFADKGEEFARRWCLMVSQDYKGPLEIAKVC